MERTISLHLFYIYDQKWGKTEREKKIVAFDFIQSFIIYRRNYVYTGHVFLQLLTCGIYSSAHSQVNPCY